MRTLITLRGESKEPSRGELERHFSAREREGFWLDLEQPGEDDYRLLLDLFGFHPLTVEDIRQQNQRPKLDIFSGYAFAVVFTVTWHNSRLRFGEHHIYLTSHLLVTVHQHPAPVLVELRKRIVRNPDLTRGELVFMQYLVANELVLSLFPTLDQLDGSIEQLEDLALTRATPQTLRRITRFKHEVTVLRRTLSAQRDAFQRLASHQMELHPQATTRQEAALFWADVHADLVRQYELVDSLRDLLVGAMDVYLSTTSNRLNATIQRLTVIASLFLPLTFLTGFFGMNFGYLVQVIRGPGTLALAVGTMAIAVAAELVFFRRRGWI